MKYQMVERLRAQYSVQSLCRVLDVARSGYYAWRKRAPSLREQADVQLKQEIAAIFESSYQTYGSPRIHAALCKAGHRCGRRRVMRLMREQGLSVQQGRRRVMTTCANPDHPAGPNRLARQFTASRPNEKWTVDITYVATGEGWLYLAGVMDLFSRKLVGWAMADHMRDELTQDALHMALFTRRPDPGLLHPSDRGSQYTSAEYQALLARHGLEVSFSLVGSCYDNAPHESIWGKLKTEWVYRHRYATRAEARSSLFLYIEGFYNRQRLHSALGYHSPQEFEHLFYISQTVH
jgi:putative transposase